MVDSFLINYRPSAGNFIKVFSVSLASFLIILFCRTTLDDRKISIRKELGIGILVLTILYMDRQITKYFDFIYN